MRFILDVIYHTAKPGWDMTNYRRAITASMWKYDGIYTIELDTNKIHEPSIIPVIKSEITTDVKKDLEKIFDIREDIVEGHKCYILSYPKSDKDVEPDIRINEGGIHFNGPYGEFSIGVEKENPIKLGREEVLETALSLITGDRAEQYDTKDDATGNFQRIADLWTPVLGREITPTEVALCLIQLKVARVITSNGHQDSWVDIAGYAGLGFEVSDNA